MDQGSAPREQGEATPIFGAGRRGYDPDQVDRYVADQQRRLDEALHRASEAERKLAAAVGQLRELHRRVAVLESEDRSPQPPALDTLGERVQRILQEAWEGAYALRQGAENEVGELRERASGEAEEIVAIARRRAQAIEEEIERRRRSYLERVEEDRARAVAQITYLHEQRKVALGELLKVKKVIEETVGEVEQARPKAAATRPVERVPAAAGPEVGRSETPRTEGAPDAPSLPPTMPVRRLATPAPESAPEVSDLVRSHRAALADDAPRRAVRPVTVEEHEAGARAAVFDFDED